MMIVEDKIIDFEKLGLGLFVHWGLYSKFAKGEWSQNILELPNYEEAFAEFNPREENIRELVRTAKQSGFKYVTLTVKHHEGFYLFDTQGISERDAMHTPFERDAVKIFVDECHRQQIAPFLYFATYDWNNDKYTRNFQAYLKELRELVQILCTKYGDIGGFWFDGNWDKPDADWEEEQLAEVIHKYQPGALIINNTGLEKQGVSRNPDVVDVLTFERGDPREIQHQQHGKYFAAETSITFNRHWGNARNDINYISAQQLIEQICRSRKVGANLLINIGPEFDAEIDLQSRALLDVVGKWMAVNGEAIYKTNHYQHETYNAANNDQDFIKGEYLFVADLGNIGNSNVVLGGEKAKPIIFNNFRGGKVQRISWLDNEVKLKFKQDFEAKTLEVYADGFEYGTHLIERVARIEFEK